jgi:AmiR/NasT family two-component response regulator
VTVTPELDDLLDDDSDAWVALRRAMAVVEATFERRAQLEHALQSRVVIEQAKGMLAERLRLSVDDAFEVLRRAARSNGLKAHAVARQILDEPETPAIVVAALHAHLTRK